MSLQTELTKLVGKVSGTETEKLFRAVKEACLKKDGEVQALVVGLATKVVLRTPVGAPEGSNTAPYLPPTKNTGIPWASSPPDGYVEGMLRGGWNVTWQTPVYTFGEIDETGKKALTQAMLVTREKGASEGTYYITNGVPYAARIEYESWSGQAPVGMMRISVAEFGELARKAKASIQTNTRA